MQALSQLSYGPKNCAPGNVCLARGAEPSQSPRCDQAVNALQDVIVIIVVAIIDVEIIIIVIVEKNVVIIIVIIGQIVG